MNNLNDHASRSHAVVNASSAYRWKVCTPSAVAAAAYPEKETAYTREGTLAHEVAERICQGAEVELTDGVTSEMIRSGMDYSDYIQEHIREPEDLVMLEQKVDFSPWVPEGFGTADCVIIHADSMDVIDYKYGAGVAVSAEQNPQMMLYGLGALNEYGFMFDVKTVNLHIFQPRMDNVSSWSISADDLYKWGEDLKPIAELASKGKGKYVPGEHCRFCPHAGKCRELTKVCTTIVEANGAKVKVPVLAPHEVAEILAKEKLISLWLNAVKAQALNTMLDGGEIPGYKVVAGRTSREWSNPTEVHQFLIGQNYTTEEVTKTELLSVAQMEKALGKKKVADLLSGYISQKSGSPTIAPETDKRPAYDKLAAATEAFG